MPYVFNPFTGTFDWTASGAGGGVPYTGATQNVNLGEYGLTGGYVTLDQTPTTATGAVGEISWNDGEGTAQLVMKGGNVTQQIGQQEYAMCYNDSGGTLTKGQVVYVSGAHGNRVAIKLAKANAESTSSGTIGFVAETITAGGEGLIIVSGALYKLNTNGLTAGYAVYLSETTAGAWTTTRPPAPNHTVILGWIERVSAIVGSIYVKVDNGYELQELHNVLITSPSNGQVLQYDSAAGVWKNSSSVIPAGSDGAMQYNNGGVLGGANVTYDDLDQSVGVQNTTPQAVVHVTNTIGTSINPPATGTATLVASTSSPAPTYGVTAIAELAAPGGFSVSQNTSYTGFVAWGQRFQYWIYPLLYTGTVQYQAYYCSYATYTDTINDGSTGFANDLSWSAVTNATGYLIQRYDTYSLNTYTIIVSGTSYQDQGFTDTDSATAWPTNYFADPIHTPYPPKSLNEAIQDDNYTGYTATGQTIDYEIDSYVLAGSTKYCSGSPQALSFTDDNSANTYGVNLSWFNGFLFNGIIIRKSFDGGVTWDYTDVGDVDTYVDDAFADDGVSSAIWGTTYTPSGFNEIVYNGYTYKLAPSGAGIYYSNYFTSGPATLTGCEFFIMHHQLSGAPAGGGYKILANASEFVPSIDYGLQTTTADFWEGDYTAWTDGTTVTPNTVGYLANGSNLTRNYKIYTYQVIAGTGTYSRNYKEITTTDPNNGLYYYVDFSWSAVPNATSYKIIRNNTSARSESGVSSIDDNIKPYPTALTVTPNTYIGTSSRFDRASTAATDYSQIQVVGIGASGSRPAKIGFGYATNGTSAATETSWIYNDNSTGNLNLIGPSVNFASSLSANTYALIQSNTVFNNASSSSASFRIKGLVSSYNFYQNALVDSVYFGNYDGTDPSGAVQIQPHSASDVCLVFKWHTGQSDATNLFVIKNASSVVQTVITAGGCYRAGNGSASAPSLSFYNDATCGFYRAGSQDIGFAIGGNQKLAFGSTAQTFSEGVNIAVGTSTGTKIGISTSQKIGFWNKTPVVQPTTGTAGAAFVANTGTTVNTGSTFDGYTLASVVAALRNVGLLA